MGFIKNIGVAPRITVRTKEWAWGHTVNNNTQNEEVETVRCAPGPTTAIVTSEPQVSGFTQLVQVPDAAYSELP